MNLLITPTPVIPATPNRRPDSVCIICLEGFVDPANSGWTHLTANGEEADHDAIHVKCLREMFNAGIYRCPHDQTMLAKNSLPARTQTVFSKAQQPVINSVCAALLGAGIGVSVVGTAQVRLCAAAISTVAIAAAGAEVNIAAAITCAAAAGAGAAAGAAAGVGGVIAVAAATGTVGAAAQDPRRLPRIGTVVLGTMAGAAVGVLNRDTAAAAAVIGIAALTAAAAAAREAGKLVIGATVLGATAGALGVGERESAAVAAIAMAVLTVVELQRQGMFVGGVARIATMCSLIGAGASVVGLVVGAGAGVGKEAGAAVAVAVAAVAAGIDETKIFDGFTRNDQINIGGGVCLGALTTMAMLDYNVETTLAITVLASGFFSGLITAMRRQ